MPEAFLLTEITGIMMNMSKGNTAVDEVFFKDNWSNSYGFWHEIINRGDRQVLLIRNAIRKINKPIIKILDIGCGEGDEMNAALSGINDKTFWITAVDTSGDALNKYRGNNPRFTKTTIQEKLECIPKKMPATSFDLVLLSHCLYDVHLTHLFNKYLNLISQEGCALVFLDSNKSDLKKIKRKFWSVVHNVDFNENAAEHVVEELKLNKIHHSTITLPYIVDLEKLDGIIKNGLETAFIPFALKMKDMRPEIIQKIQIYIKTLRGGRFLKNKTAAIIFWH
ncbi:MAG: class I SAM-dependent methyltransferase [bacterium]|nr:class I SAM-dependent methyltransferase [bacterium]